MSAVPNEPESSSTPQAVLQLRDICLDFESKKDAYEGKLRRFVEQHRGELDLAATGDPVPAYLQRIFADGLTTTLIAANVSFNEYLQLLIRPVATGPLASSFAAGGQVPAFHAYQRKARLVIDGFLVVPHVYPRPFEVPITGQIRVNPTSIWMTSADLSALQTLPRPRLSANERLAAWVECVEWRKKLIQIQRIALRYEGVEATSNGAVRFFVDAGQHRHSIKQKRSTPISVAPVSASRSPTRWDPDPQHRPRTTFAGELVRVQPAGTSRDSQDDDPSPALADPALILTVSIDTDDDLERTLSAIPQEGFVLSSIAGDIKPVQSEGKAISRLRRGQGHNAYLADFLFDVRNAALPQTIPDVLASEKLPVQLNEEQRLAVNKALAAIGIFLIEGPPGTGKTEIIIVLCYLVIKNGGRVLLSSQANLAIDNPIMRMFDYLIVRPLRIAKPERINLEAGQFHEDNVTHTWLRAIRQECRGRSQKRDDLQLRIPRAEEGFTELQGIASESHPRSLEGQELQGQIGKLTERKGKLLADRDRARQEAEVLQREHSVLSELGSWLDDPTAVPPSAALLAESQAADLLAESAQRVQNTLAAAAWPLPWLEQARAPSPATSITIIRHAWNAATAAGSVEAPLAEAVSICQGITSWPDAPELQALLAEKHRLMDSESEEDLRCLAGINRQIKKLLGDHWSTSCLRIREHLEVIFAGQVPDELDCLTSALSPDSRWLDTLGKLSAFATHVSDRIKQLFAEAIPHLRAQIREIAEQVGHDADNCLLEAQEADRKASQIEASLGKLERRQQEIAAELQALQSQWNGLWPHVCMDLDGCSVEAPAVSSDALKARRSAFDTWLEANAGQRNRHRRWRPLLDKWLDQLAEPAAADRADLKALYRRNANLIGLTCFEAGQPGFYADPEFEPFDTVIMDEVSKATPSELLMPMMLGRKVVLVGDHRQLPPMFREREASYAEAVAEGELDPEDFKRFRELVTASFFQELYGSAPGIIRQLLTRQYRGHPQIMDVVNLFYGGMLRAGGGREAIERKCQHHLTVKDNQGGVFLEPRQHVLWVDSTKDARGRIFTERQRGTSKVNYLEADLIVAALLKLNQALCERGYGPVQEAPAGRSEDGMSLQTWVKRLLPGSATETIAELFKREQVLLDDRPGAPDEQVRCESILKLDARKAVGVITFYGAQLGEIRRRIKQAEERDTGCLSAMHLRTNTVDRFQGMERPIILVSLVRSRRTNARMGEFVKQYQRINVALSRAQQLLVIIGAAATFRQAVIDLPSMDDGQVRQVRVYDNIYKLIQQYGGIRYAKQLL